TTGMTLLFAKNFWDLSVKAGLIESTGGFGVDYSFYKRKFKFSVEAFDFGQTNLRTSLSYNFYHGLYLNTGMSDLLDSNQARSTFVGAGLYLTNDDLKLLLTRSPF
ncbi:MAG TPA: MCE family protein, partial [Pseudobdellovibrionaceae bacterium]|nr:MCE family protein [Pseudobdellovibrionaceae bacterium]